MKFNEPRNAELFYNMARLFARYCGRREAVLDKISKMLDEGIMLEPENADFHSEIALHKCMVNDFTTAY